MKKESDIRIRMRKINQFLVPLIISFLFYHMKEKKEEKKGEKIDNIY